MNIVRPKMKLFRVRALFILLERLYGLYPYVWTVSHCLSQLDLRALSCFNQYAINFHLGCENQVILQFLRAYHDFIYYNLRTLKQRLKQYELFGKAKDDSTF